MQQDSLELVRWEAQELKSALGFQDCLVLVDRLVLFRTDSLGSYLEEDFLDC